MDIEYLLRIKSADVLLPKGQLCSSATILRGGEPSQKHEGVFHAFSVLTWGWSIISLTKSAIYFAMHMQAKLCEAI